MTDPESPPKPRKPQQCTQCYRRPVIWRGLDRLWFATCCVHEDGKETTGNGTRDDVMDMWDEGVLERRRLKEKIKEAAEKRKKAKERKKKRKKAKKRREAKRAAA